MFEKYVILTTLAAISNSATYKPWLMISYFDNNPEISAKELRQAIEILRPVLGEAFANSIVHDFELYGLLSSNGSFTLEQIHIALERIFGEGASMLMRLIVKALFEK